MLYLLLAPLALYGLVYGLRYLLTFLHLRKLRIQSPAYSLLAADQVPSYLKTLFQPPLAELKGLGFKPCCYVQIRGLAKTEPASLIGLLFYHPGRKTYATLGVKLLAEPGDLFEIDFYTLFTDQTLLLTLNGRAYGVVGTIPQVVLQDPYAIDTATQWQMHEQTLDQLNKTACGLVPDRFVGMLEASLHRYIEHLLQTHRAVKADPGELRLTLRAIGSQTWKSVQGMAKSQQLLQKRRQLNPGKSSPELIDIPVEVEVQSYRRMEFLQQDLLGRKTRSWMLWVSLALFVTTYTQLFDSQTFLLFIAALLLHEGGHLLAMKLFGYRDLALLFLPFLGALATAHKQDASLSQKFWISLAGPLPGLILGLGLLALTQGQSSGWWVEASWILIGLNLFNLLPIYPLDGGQIADLLLFSRHPYLGVGFKGLGVGLLGLLGLGQPMLLLFAGLIALGIPNSFRAAKLTVKLRQVLGQTAGQTLGQTMSQTPVAEPDALLSLVFQTIKQQGQGRLPFAQRYSLAKHLLLSRRELEADWLTRLGLGLVYSFSLVIGLVGTVATILPLELVTELPLGLPWEDRGQALLSRYQSEQQRQIDQATAALAANPADLAAYKQRALARTNLQDPVGALADYDQIVQLAPRDTEARLRRAMYRSLTGDHRAAVQDYNLILGQDARNQEALQARAQTYGLLKNYRSALADYSALIQLTPADSWLYLERGHVRQQLRDHQGALADANAVLRLELNHPEAYQLRSAARRSLGDLPGAEADRQQAEQMAD
jgi:tetratricopeptide (TPR) repeat protein/Zn-dependent protease